MILNLFLEKIDFFEDFLIRKKTRLNLLNLVELQYTYPLFFLEKQIPLQKKGFHNLILNYRKFWENSSDLYDWHFLHFSDSRWQDFIPFSPIPNYKQYKNVIKNLWPAHTLFSELRWSTFNTNFKLDPILFDLYTKEQKEYWEDPLANQSSLMLEYIHIVEDMETYRKYNIPPTLLSSFDEQLKKTFIMEEEDFIKFPEYFNVDFSLKHINDFNTIKKNFHFNETNFLINNNKDTFSEIYFEQKINFPNQLTIKKNLLQRYIPPQDFYSNFLYFLNQKNKVHINDWFQLDRQYFFFYFYFIY